MTTLLGLEKETAVLVCTIFFLSAVVTSLAVAEPPTQHAATKADRGGLSQVSGYLSSAREKRSLWHLVMRGAEAAILLFRGAKRVPSHDKSIRIFEKQGDYDKALKDFGSVSPKDVKYIHLPDGSKGMVGHVGDKTFFLESDGDYGLPTMMITRSIGRVEKGSDKIVYIQDGGWYPDWYSGPANNIH